MATITNFTIDQGTTFSSVIDIDNQATGVFQLNSYTARGKIRKSRSSQSYTSFTCAISENSPSQDTITISLAASDSAALKAGRYVYDIEIHTSNSPQEVIRILEGQIEIIESITQASPLGEGIEFKYTEENYVSHTMYHPTTGEAFTAATYADHVTYANYGYVHVQPLGGGGFVSGDSTISDLSSTVSSDTTTADSSADTDSTGSGDSGTSASEDTASY